jgi:hypothetical protein
VCSESAIPLATDISSRVRFCKSRFNIICIRYTTCAYNGFQSRQKFYRRVTLSFHITYLTLNSHDTIEDKEDLLDRATIFPFQHCKGVNDPSGLCLFKSSSSVLLKLAIPEESESREEEVSLLRTHRALWTVLVVNCPSECASDHGPRQFLTPIAQYIRGIVKKITIE